MNLVYEGIINRVEGKRKRKETEEVEGDDDDDDGNDNVNVSFTYISCLPIVIKPDYSCFLFTRFLFSKILCCNAIINGCLLYQLQRCLRQNIKRTLRTMSDNKVQLFDNGNKGERATMVRPTMYKVRDTRPLL